MTLPKNWADMSLDALWFTLNDQRRVGRAAQSTVEALMYSLRERGLTALHEPDCQRRLGQLANDQVREVVERLNRLRPKYPLISSNLLLLLAELINERKDREL